MTAEFEKVPDSKLQGPIKTVDEQKKTILIYSPDLNFCFSLSMLFQDRYNVITTTTASRLEDLVTHDPTSLLIVDAAPTDKLLGLLLHAKELNRQLPIIVLYVYSPEKIHLDRTIRNAVDSVFYKPFDLPAVSRRIDELLPA